MVFLLDLLVSMAMIAVLIGQLMSNFNYVVASQKNQNNKLLLFEHKQAIEEVLRADLRMAFDPTESLKLFDRANKSKKDSEPKEGGAKELEKDKGDAAKKDKNDKEKKLPEPFYLSLDERKYLSKIFKTKVQPIKTISFVTCNSLTLPKYQPCRVTYALDQVSGKSDASEVLYKIYRFESTDLKEIPKLKTVKKEASVLCDNVLEFVCNPVDYQDFQFKQEDVKPVKKEMPLAELFDKDLTQRLENKKDDKKEPGEVVKDKKKESTEKKPEPDKKEAKSLPQLYVFKLAYKDAKRGKAEKIEKIELEALCVSSGSDKAANKKDEAPKKDSKPDDKDAGKDKEKPAEEAKKDIGVDSPSKGAGNDKGK